MITKELIDTELGAILAEMGTPVCNAALWQEELGDKAPTEEAILTKKAERDAAIAAKAAIISAGYDTKLGFNIGVEQKDQTLLGSLALGNLITNFPIDGEVEIWDTANVMHTITQAEFETIMAGYVPYCKALYKASKQ